MYYVYFLKSVQSPDQTYIGFTNNLKERLTKHNAGRSPHTKKYMPWQLVTFIGFSSKEKAIEFEQYIKVGSGSAFARKRFW